MSRANEEQLLAIEHEGGVLLKAGAGSGKTFVLVEHVLYRTKKIMESSALDPTKLEAFLRKSFSRTVLMTFTNKAAGEMRIRLSERFGDLAAEVSPLQGHWVIARDTLPFLTVTTIDGFCRKLIAGGYFPGLSTNAEIIFETHRLVQVRELFNQWFDTSLPPMPKETLETLIREKNNLLSAFCGIFGDPGIRLAWKRFTTAEAHPRNLGELLSKSFELNGLPQILSAVEELPLSEDSERSEFEKLIAQFQAMDLRSVESDHRLQEFFALFSSIKVLRGERGKKKTFAHEAAKEALVCFRDWVRKWAPSVEAFSQQFEEKAMPWLEVCTHLFAYIDARLNPNQGMTFGDIEYGVALGLANEDHARRIRETFDYFIVDEFQDTSALQFDIINRLSGGDFGKLFCVGDAKQAIYGFRGGELSVFNDCAEAMPKTLSLANNYRSLPAVIEFNNSLFRTILPAGQEFTGEDPFTVAPEDQRVPPGLEFHRPGMVECLRAPVSFEEGVKLSADEVNRLEARALAQAIARRRQAEPEEVCTVLYAKLKPSPELLRELMDLQIGFTAQFKINLSEEPIIGIFLVLLRRRFDRNPDTQVSFPLLMIQTYLRILGVERSFSVQDLGAFDDDITYWGLVPSFRKFLFRLNVTNENHEINLSFIETICELYDQDLEAVLVNLTSDLDQKVNLEFRSGTRSNLVQIMTAHASKGLEFDTVYLGGIYTNGRDLGDRDMFGKLPASFYWYTDLLTKEKQKSPQYLFESELNRYKTFSEAKRLFYVACTRAKKRLAWVDLEGIDNHYTAPKNGWLRGLRHWLEHTPDLAIRNTLTITNLDSQDESAPTSVGVQRLPLFFRDPMGIIAKPGAAVVLSLVPELSVTGLNALVDCPRKFYFQNVLKLRPSGEPVVAGPRMTSFEGEENIVSSSARGSLIHQYIAKGLQHNFIVPREVFLLPDARPVQWALEALRPYQHDRLIIERPMKFRLFNFMISGIPDLVILPSNGEGVAQVWDFKTGRLSAQTLERYWIQLDAYAYALFINGLWPRTELISLTLAFVDEQRSLLRTVAYPEVAERLAKVWQLQDNPRVVNTDHCSQCSYGDICPR